MNYFYKIYSEKLTLEKPITEDAGQLSDINNKSSIKVLPRSLNDALSFLKKNKVFRSNLGEIIFDEFLTLRAYDQLD